jgi:hypothetical protein
MIAHMVKFLAINLAQSNLKMTNPIIQTDIANIFNEINKYFNISLFFTIVLCITFVVNVLKGLVDNDYEYVIFTSLNVIFLEIILIIFTLNYFPG